MRDEMRGEGCSPKGERFERGFRLRNCVDGDVAAILKLCCISR